MKKIIALLPIISIMLLPSLVMAPSAAYTVIVSGEDIWFGASNVSGQWRGGGSVCGTSMVQPKPPPMPGAIVLARITVTGGGPGTFGYPAFTDVATGESVLAGSHSFAVDAQMTVMYSIDPMFPTGTVAPVRATFDYTEGHSDQNVVAWMGVAPGVYVPVRLVHNAHVVINTVDG